MWPSLLWFERFHFSISYHLDDKCLECLICDSKQSSDDLCNICYVEELGQSACIKLFDCGHIFHFDCVKNKISSKWPGSRITFNFMNCPLCNVKMNHPSIDSISKEINELNEKVKEMSLLRLKFENLQNSDDIIKEDGKFYKNETGYSMYHFAYYQCYQCTKPYFGGMKRCENIERDNFDPKELVCGSCVAKEFKNIKECPTHKTEFIDFKCRYCCNIATFFCWGSTHFCDSCHKIHYLVTKKEKDQLPKCEK
jgi:hypothetical protein